MKKIVLVFLLLSQVVFADELLELLEGSSNESIVADASDLVTALRKDLRKPTAEQNIFLQFLDKSEYKSALFQWEAAFATSAYASTGNGRALQAYLMYKNGLKLNALEFLLSGTGKKQILPELSSQWKEIAPEDDKIWNYISVPWNQNWNDVFGKDIAARVLSYQISAHDPVEKILEGIKLSKPSSNARAWLEWQIVLAFALQDKSEKAVKVLAHLMKTNQDLIGKDIMTITAARMLYQRGYLNAAIDYYKKVKKTSEYWFVAQEEMAWAYIRKGEPQNTLAITRSLIPDEFRAQVGPESIFLRSLAQLKVCDYTKLIATIKLFRSRFRERAKEMLKVAQNPDTPEVNFLFQQIHEKETVKLLDLKEKALKLPRYVSRDRRLEHMVRIYKILQSEAKVASELYSSSLTEGTAKVGFQASFEKLKQSFLQRSHKARSEAVSEVQKLARAEVNHIHQILQKMHIVDAELVQQVSVAQRVANENKTAGKTRVGSTGSKDPYSLEFVANNELWFDEVGNYKVDVSKACTSKKGDKL